MTKHCAYIDWTKARRVVFPNLTPSVRTISLRLPVTIIARLKQLANKRDMPYQSLLKMFLAERLDEEVAEQRPPLTIGILDAGTAA